MTRDDDLRIRPGRIRSRGGRAKPFLARALAAAEMAGGLPRRAGATPKRASTFGRGRAASLSAVRLLRDRSRLVTVKARVVRQRGRGAPLAAHLAYLRREGVTRDGEAGRMFDAGKDEADHRAFAARCDGDRHHFRFIVSPEDAAELADLRGFTRDLMARMERDLGTGLDWIAVDHWNTEHPHVHVLVRGRAGDGDLVISRDYIKEGMRARARELVTEELGLRSEREIHRSLERQVEAERWTRLDRVLASEAARNDGVVDLRPERARGPDELDGLKIGRMRKLERLGLARPVGPGRWILAETVEPTLRELGVRNDVIKRIERGLADRDIERDGASFVLAGESLAEQIVGRLIARGLDDELKGTAYAVVDGIDGRTHHIRLPDLEAASDAAPGAIVELRPYDDARGRSRIALAVRSDLGLEDQVTAPGATWLDRQLVAREPLPLGEGGFGAEVRWAIEARADHMTGEGLARRQGQRLVLARDLLDTLRRRELDSAAEKLSADTGLPYRPAAAGEPVGGTYRRRIDLASGRFAMIDDGLGFALVPWSPSLERHLGREVSGIARADGGIAWSFGRKRGLGL